MVLIIFFLPALSKEWKIVDQSLCENEDHVSTCTYVEKVVLVFISCFSLYAF
jgi:hypothetical protein